MGNRTVISVDCICDLPRKMWEDLDVSMMYFYVKTEEGRFQDIREVNAENVVEYLNQGKRAYSSSASMKEYREHFEKIRKKHDGPIIHISAARYVSVAYETAIKATEGMEDIYIVDSGHLSGALSLMVLEAAEMAKVGADYELILKEMDRMREKVVTSFVVDSIEHMYLNGRINKRISRLCGTFSLHPILSIKNSRMKVAGVCVGNNHKYVRAYIRKILRKPENIDNGVVFLASAGCSYEYVNYIKEEIQKRVKWKRIIIISASATVTCNCGPGTVGILFARK